MLWMTPPISSQGNSRRNSEQERARRPVAACKGAVLFRVRISYGSRTDPSERTAWKGRSLDYVCFSQISYVFSSRFWIHLFFVLQKGQTQPDSVLMFAWCQKSPDAHKTRAGPAIYGAAMLGSLPWRVWPIVFRARAVDIQCITEHCALKCKLSYAAYAYMQYVFRLLQCVLLVAVLPQGFVCSIFEPLRFGRIGILK